MNNKIIKKYKVTRNTPEERKILSYKKIKMPGVWKMKYATEITCSEFASNFEWLLFSSDRNDGTTANSSLRGDIVSSLKP